MTEREQQIVRALLHYAHNLDGRQAAEPLLHAGANLALEPRATKAEFDAALALCDAHGWLTGITSRFGGRRWNLNDAGEAARLEMR